MQILFEDLPQEYSFTLEENNNWILNQIKTRKVNYLKADGKDLITIYNSFYTYTIPRRHSSVMYWSGDIAKTILLNILQ